MTAVPERVRWAIALLDPRPGERVLDVGSGTGVSVAELVARATPGAADAATAHVPATADSAVVVAIDRSAKAVDRIRARCARAVADGLIETRAVGLDALELDPPVDAALAVDVNVFWTSDARAEVDALARALRPGGRLVVAYGSGPGDPERRLAATQSALTARGGFHGIRRASGPSATAVVATRSL